MAATITVQGSVDIGGTKKLYWGTFALDNSYPTGGEAIDATSNERFDSMWFNANPSATVGYAFSFDSANQKIMALRTDQVDDPMEEVPNTTDLSAITAAQFWAIGS